MPPESNNSSPQKPAPEGSSTPDPKAVASRAEGRPPEEASSDNPRAQAQAILEESEQRITDGMKAADSEPESMDEQLGSPGLTFETGWLLGVVLGLIVIVVIGRRLRRRRRQRRQTADSIEAV